jgi:hypothetical protein
VHTEDRPVKPGVTRPPLPTDNFTTIDNAWLRDRMLNLKEKGMLGYLLTHEAGYHLSIQQIVAETRDGKDAVETTLASLATRGWLVREQIRADDGTFLGVAYEVTIPEYMHDITTARDAALAVKRTTTRKPVTGKPGSGSDQGKQAVGDAPRPATGFSGHGESGDGESVHGKSAPKKNISKNTTLEKINNPPGSSSTHSPRDPAPQPGGTEPAPEPQPEVPQPEAPDVDADPRRTPALVALASELAALGGWDAPATEHAMLDMLAAGRPSDQIIQVLRAAASGAYGETGSPRRFIRFWPPTMAVAAPEPSWVRGPIVYLDPDRERCRTHPSEPSGTCGRCRSESLAAVDPDPVEPGELSGPRGRELARMIASGARTPARVLAAVA